MNKVNFFIIGAQKSATTSLYNYLSEHPDIFMPQVKENHFFVDDRIYKKGIAHFHKYYKSYSNEKLIGGAYVHMLSSKEAPERVYHYNPDAKFLIMLRNPIDRAYSAYHFAIKNGWESPTTAFMDTIQMEQQRLHGSLTERTDLSYFYVGLYSLHLSNWFKYFPKDRFLILFDSDFFSDTHKEVKKVLQFLSVADSYNINTNKVYNKSGDVRFKKLHHFLRNKDSKIRQGIGKFLPFGLKSFYRRQILSSIDKFNKIEKEYKPLPLSDKERLFKYFEEDLKNLSALVGKDVYTLWNPVQRKTEKDEHNVHINNSSVNVFNA